MITLLFVFLTIFFSVGLYALIESMRYERKVKRYIWHLSKEREAMQLEITQLREELDACRTSLDKS